MQRFKLKPNLFLIPGIVLWMTGCTPPEEPTLFTELPPGQSGIGFSNNITETPGSTRGIFVPSGSRTQSAINEFLYMGGGVGIGDFNRDGLQDIFFAGNQVTSRLYLNMGPNGNGPVRFRDVTEQAGISTEAWATGVSIADVNSDGYDDIYLCVYGGKNLLFINNGDDTGTQTPAVPSFTERAEEYGLAYDGPSTQAVFFDYDKDAYTDLFLINYRLNGPNPNRLLPKDLSGHSPANDRLYRNLGVPEDKNHPVFTDVTEEAGIAGSGYALGVVATDLNGNGRPDLYVANDFLHDDEIWLNNTDGTFANVAGQALRHQSYSSMGVDAADLNNDLRPDIITLDMDPEINERKKLQYTFMNQQRYDRERALGYEPSFMRNMLQLNNGTRKQDGGEIPFFSETGRYAGVAETDWSWSVLAADFTNDGWSDLYITNGSGRDYLNADFIGYSLSEEIANTEEAKQKRLLTDRLRSLGFIKLPNVFYVNNRDYTFTNLRDASGLNTLALSTGAAYADLDNDGDLDLIVNHINETASVYLNNTIRQYKTEEDPAAAARNGEDAHYLQTELTGPEGNPDAFGTKVLLFAKGTRQLREKYPVRGYLSSTDSRLFFGLGSAGRADSLLVIWPDHRMEIYKDVPADTLLDIRYGKTGNLREMASPLFEQPPSGPGHTIFRDVTDESGVRYKHTDVPYNDYSDQPLLPQKYSQQGPFIASGDINNNGLTDFFAGGGFNSSGVIFRQTENGGFEYTQFDTTIKYQEDMDVLLFDSNGNGRRDLLITYGDTRYDAGSPYYRPRLYINDGQGNFRIHPNAVPEHVRTIAGTAAAEDFDGDGLTDLFIGGQISKSYPLPPKSFLLKNENGVFRDVTEEIAPELMQPGMITDAVWADFDGDGTPDLVITGEWMPVRFFRNQKDHLQEVTPKGRGPAGMQGLWRSLAACDVNGDGHTDFVAGNLGRNNIYNITAETPLKLFAADLDENGLMDPVRFYHRRDRSGRAHLYPAVQLDELLRQVPGFQTVFSTHREYAEAGFDELFGHIRRDDLFEFTVTEDRSVYLENSGDGTFAKRILPAEAQFAPVNSIICEDLNGDGHTDLLLAGNEYQTGVRTGRQDASYGLFLQGNGENGFDVVPPSQSGLITDGDVKDMELIRTADNRQLVVVAVNNDSLRVFEVRNGE